MIFAVVTGGGTSGHVVPAIAVIEALQDAGHPAAEIAYVGSRRGVESRMVPGTGVECRFLPVSGLQRSFSPRGIGLNLLLPFRLLRSTLIARRLVRGWRPGVVVSVGGYASEPMARAAAAAGVPLVCISYDAVPGLATRRQSRRAAACAVAFEGSALPNAVVTGAPVRRSVRTMDRASERQRVRRLLGIDEDKVLVTFVGGSLGSAALNATVAPVADALLAAGVRAHIHHVTGDRFAGAPVPGDRRTVSISRTGTESDMPGILAATDVLVSRAGASTVAEIASVGVPAVLVPWPGAADNHQDANAMWLAADGAAVVIRESPALADELASAVVGLVLDPASRARLAAAAHGKGALNRSGAIANVVEMAARTS